MLGKGAAREETISREDTIPGDVDAKRKAKATTMETAKREVKVAPHEKANGAAEERQLRHVIKLTCTRIVYEHAMANFKILPTFIGTSFV